MGERLTVGALITRGFLGVRRDLPSQHPGGKIGLLALAAAESERWHCLIFRGPRQRKARWKPQNPPSLPCLQLPGGDGHWSPCCEGSRGAIRGTMTARPGICRRGAFACWHSAFVETTARQVRRRVALWRDKTAGQARERAAEGSSTFSVGELPQSGGRSAATP
jgi:hypothetical protein